MNKTIDRLVRRDHTSLRSRIALRPGGLGWLCAVFLAGPVILMAGPPAGGEAQPPFRPSPTPRLTVHEWGTFTAVQDEDGRSLAGINTDDQPVPRFVHRLADYLLIAPGDLAPIFCKGAPRCHPDITLRLETPVIYFYPPAGAALPLSASVRAAFRSGWITEFFPQAEVNAPGLKARSFDFGPLNSGVTGSVAWWDLSIGDEPTGPVTDSPVWLAPRAVRSAGVGTPSRESERYLFYRGVAHLAAPLRVSRDPKTGACNLRPQSDPAIAVKSPLDYRALWLVDVRADGAVAYRTLPPMAPDSTSCPVAGGIPTDFGAPDHAVENLAALTRDMQTALVREGLFSDEAHALLRTWEAAYFKSPGLRVFFLVPRAWTDAVLPLEISPAADVTRVMVGRIELVTDEQRRLLKKIASRPPTASQWFWEAAQAKGDAAFQTLFRGEKSLRDLGITVPPEYQAYLDLGRFRNALVLDEQRRHPSTNLGRFIREYELAYSSVPSK